MLEQNPATPTDIEGDPIDPQWIPTINRQFRLQWEAAQDCYVLLYPEGMVKLNPSAGEILSRCDGERSVQTIIDQLVQQFPEAENIDRDILTFLAEARRNQWLDHD